MIRSVALTFGLAMALAPAAALAQASGGYIGAPLPRILTARNPCDGAEGATPTEWPRLPRARRPRPISRSCCVTHICTEGAGF